MRAGRLSDLTLHYIGFPVGHQVEGEYLAECLPGGVELVENEAPAVRAENFVVKIHQNLVFPPPWSCSVERQPDILSIW